jgi:hypothetical protein
MFGKKVDIAAAFESTGAGSFPPATPSIAAIWGQG